MGIVREIKDIGRLEKILSVLVRYELGYFVDKLKMKHIIPAHLRAQKKKFQKKETEPEVIRKIMEELGGAFLKLGQILSLRPDLIPNEYCEEFKNLQDHVKPFSGDEAKKIVEGELSASGKKLAYFNKKPLASGSIAQVHEAILNSTQKVIIKVQRPDAREKFKRDIDLLHYLVKILIKRHDFKTIDPMEILQEFERYTEEEFDFEREGRNIDTFYENFKDIKIVKIPKVYWEYCTDRILTMEYLHGHNIEHIKKTPGNYNRRRNIAKRVTDMLLKQIFEDGFFHADPHPGNIFIMRNDVIGLIDFGILGRINDDVKKAYTLLVSGLVYMDAEGMAEALIKLHFSRKGRVDMASLKDELSDFIAEYHNVTLEKMDLGLMIHRIINIARKNNMRIPTDMVLLGKALVTVKSFSEELDPKFNLFKSIRPFFDKMKKQEFSPKNFIKRSVYTFQKLKDMLIEMPSMTSELVESLSDADRTMEDIDKDIRGLSNNITRSVDIIAIVLLAVGFLMASVMMINFGDPVFYGIPLLPLIGFSASGIFLLVLIFAMLRNNFFRK
jgi:ubiquinone biosynthesis protein